MKISLHEAEGDMGIQVMRRDERGAMGRLYDVMAVWREYAANVSGKGLPGGHNIQEDSPKEVVTELLAFL